MGRAKRVGSGTRKAGVAIEYIRTRKVVRVLGWRDDAPLEPVEIPVDQLCGQLGIDPRDLGARPRYLLFAGSHRRPAGGLRDLVGTFGDEDRASAAFHALRESHPSTQGWAELAVVDAMGQIAQLAWFGLHEAKDDDASAAGAAGAADARGPARPAGRTGMPPRGLARPSAPPSAYLRAVTPS